MYPSTDILMGHATSKGTLQRNISVIKLDDNLTFL